MKRPLSLVCDLETTGLDPTTDQICEVAFIVTDFVDIYAAVESLIKPSGGFTLPDNTSLTHEMLTDAPAFHEMAGPIVALYAWCDEFIAYNAGFDQRFLSAELARCGWSLPVRSVIDPMLVLQGRDRRRYRLADACEKLQVDLGPEYPWHRAFADCAATLKLVQALRVSDGNPEMAAASRSFGVRVRM